jgi:hypothetical protein
MCTRAPRFKVAKARGWAHTSDLCEVKNAWNYTSTPPYDKYTDNFTRQSLQNFSAVSRSARIWLVGSQIDMFKFVSKTDILMVHASFCRSTIQPFPCLTQYNCPLNIRVFILSGLIQGLSTITTLQLYCTAILHPPDIREYLSCSVQDNDKRNALYIKVRRLYMTQKDC